MSSRSRTCSCTCRKPRLALAIGKRSPRRTKANWATAEDVAVVTARVDSAYLTGGIGGSSAGTSGPPVPVGAPLLTFYPALIREKKNRRQTISSYWTDQNQLKITFLFLPRCESD